MGRISGSMGATSRGALAKLAVMPDRRLPHVATAIGDSRIAALYLDGARQNRAATSPLNWANALAGQRLTIGATFGVSGDRTDQMLGRLDAAIATGAGLLYIQGGVNDIGQSYPTAATSGATAFANIRAMAEAARTAGMTVVIEAEVGGATIGTPALVAQVEELNARLFAYAEGTPGVHVHDARAAVMNPVNADGALQYRAGFAYDGTHVNGRGACAWGESLSMLLTAIVPARAGRLIQNRAQLPANGRRQLAANPLFATATGGTAGTGVTGAVPMGWSVTRTGAATATVSTAASALDMGNDVTIDMSFTAAGEQIRLIQTIAPTDWQPGDVAEGVAQIDYLGTPTGLAGVFLQLQHNTGAGGASYDSMDLFSPNSTGYVAPAHAMTLTLRTKGYAVPPTVGAGAYQSISVRAVASGAGNARIMVRQIGVRRV